MSKVSNSLKGQLLVASPNMGDRRFARTVVLVLQHQPKGAVGVVLNRPLIGPLDGPWQAIEEMAMAADCHIHWGGPVMGPLIVLQGAKTGSTNRVFMDADPHVQLTEVGGMEQLQQVLATGQHGPTRVFVGHSIWKPGQLEQEIAAGCWMTTPFDQEFALSEHEDMWIEAIRETGRNFCRDVLGMHQFPDDVTAN